jgi:geranylgeranyl diphosphate synthase type I
MLNSQDINKTAIEKHINDLLLVILDARLQQAERLSHDYLELWQAIRSTAMGGGKRLRPYLVFVGYLIAGGEDTDTVWDVAVAIELLHQCLLIHDDIIDHDLIRHNHENVAGIMRHKYAEHSLQAAHLADSAALLAGDLLLSEAYNQIRVADISEKTRQSITARLHEAVFNVGGGELLDTESLTKPLASDDVLLIAELKTADYTFVMPLQCGADIAGADSVLMQNLQRIGIALGTAFQLKDDILGIFGDSQILGKSTTSDIREGKHTLLMQMCYLNANDVERRELEDVLGKTDSSEEQINNIRTIVKNSGALTSCEEKIENLFSEAIGCLNSMNMSEFARALIDGLIQQLRKRDY